MKTQWNQFLGAIRIVSVTSIIHYKHQKMILAFLDLLDIQSLISHVSGMCVSRSEDSFQESVLSFHYVGSRDQTQFIRLSGKHLYSSSFSEVEIKGSQTLYEVPILTTTFGGQLSLYHENSIIQGMKYQLSSMKSYLYKKAVDQIWPKVNYLLSLVYRTKHNQPATPKQVHSDMCADSFHGVNTPTMPASKLPCNMVKMDFRSICGSKLYTVCSPFRND